MAGSSVHYRRPNVLFPGEINETTKRKRLRLGGTIDEEFSDLRGGPEETKILQEIANPQNWAAETVEDDLTLVSSVDGQRVPDEDLHVADFGGHLVFSASRSELPGLIVNRFCSSRRKG